MPVFFRKIKYEFKTLRERKKSIPQTLIPHTHNSNPFLGISFLSFFLVHSLFTTFNTTRVDNMLTRIAIVFDRVSMQMLCDILVHELVEVCLFSFTRLIDPLL